jgi:excisionase family DNA binding protein
MLSPSVIENFKHAQEENAMVEWNYLLTINEFADALRVKASCVRRWIEEEKITIVHVGRLVRIPAMEVTRIIRQGTRRATRE